MALNPTDAARQRARYAADPEKHRARRRAYYAANPQLGRDASRRWAVKNRERKLEYGRKWRAANPLYGSIWDGLPTPTRGCPEVCECCNRPPNGSGRLHIDHCHSSGAFRGWLCSSCNVGIGNLGDSIAGLERGLLYLHRTSSDQDERNADK